MECLGRLIAMLFRWSGI